MSRPGRYHPLLPMPNPVRNLATMNMATWTDPACSAPPTTQRHAEMKMAFLRPRLSAAQLHARVPIKPPAWNSPLMAPSSWVVFVARSKPMYEMKLGWPSVVAMMQAQYP